MSAGGPVILQVPNAGLGCEDLIPCMHKVLANQKHLCTLCEAHREVGVHVHLTISVPVLTPQ